MKSATSIASVVLAAAPALGSADSAVMPKTSVSLAESIVPDAAVADAPVPSEFSVKFEWTGWCPRRIEIPGHATLAMTHIPDLYLSYTSSIFKIPTWGISVSQQPDERLDKILVREMIRTFTRISHGARAQTLSQDDRAIWQQMLADFDYADYCDQTTPFVWTTGKRVKTTKDGVCIAWDEDKQECLTGEAAKALDFINDGETFGAMVKYRKFKTAQIKEATPLVIEPIAAQDLSWISG